MQGFFGTPNPRCTEARSGVGWRRSTFAMKTIPLNRPQRKAARPRGLHYYDLQRNWRRKVKPHLGDRELNAILVRDFNKFTTGRWGKPFRPGQFPRDFESC